MKQNNTIHYLAKQLYCFAQGPVLVVVLLFCVLLPATSVAQSLGGGSMTVSRTSINASNEELVDLMIKITNTSPIPLEGTLVVTIPAGFEIVSKQTIPVLIESKDSIFVPVKIFVSKKAASARVHTLRFILQNKYNIELAQATTQVRVSANRKASLFTMVSNILLDNNMDSVIIPVRISNAGNTTQKITVITAYPADVQDVAFHSSLQISLQAATDTLIYFAKRVTRKISNSEGFNVTVTGLYENGDLVGMAYVRVQSARSNRNYQGYTGSEFYNENSITLSSQSMFTQTQSYMLRGNGSTDLAGGKLGYNMDLTTWQNSYSPAMLRNTWIDYQKNNMGVRVGNINRYFDINLSGRGASAYIIDTGSANRYEIGYIDGNTNLLGDKYAYFPIGQAAWGTFKHAGKKWQLNSFALYEDNPALDAKNQIVGNTLSFVTPKKIYYSFSLNASRTAEYLNPDSAKFGMAASAGINGTIGRLSISSLNYFSSGYYPGIQRGAISLSEKFTWMMNSATSIWLTMDYNRYSPKTLSAAQFVLPSFGMIRAELGIAGKAGKINLSGAPRFTQESSNAYQFANFPADQMHSLNAWDMTGSASYPIGDNHYVSVNTEAGMYTTSFDPGQYMHMRSNLYYRKGIFSLNATVQLGTFFLGEAANNYTTKIQPRHLINIIPAIQKSFFRNTLRAEASIGYMENGFSGSSFYLSGRAEYDITRKTIFYAMANYNRYAGFGYSIIEMGITQKLQLPKATVKKHTLEVFVYKDINRNGAYDAADSAASGYLLYINDDIFISSADGSILYKNIPPGSYRLNMPASKGWYAPEQTIEVDKKSRIEIPLQQTGTIKGGISYISGEFSYDVNTSLSGISVIAMDSHGRTFTTKTGIDGNFVLYIPVGQYTISLDKASLVTELEALNNDQQVTIATAGVKVVNFQLKAKSRKIETKKFVSPGLPKNPSKK